MAKEIGKTMADFRNTTNEYRSTWQREVDFDEEARALRRGELPESEPAPLPRTQAVDEGAHTIAPPEIRAVQTDLFTDLPADANIEKAEEPEPSDELSDK